MNFIFVTKHEIRQVDLNLLTSKLAFKMLKELNLTFKGLEFKQSNACFPQASMHFICIIYQIFILIDHNSS